MYEKPKKTLDMYGKNIFAYITSLHEQNIFNCSLIETHKSAFKFLNK